MLLTNKAVQHTGLLFVIVILSFFLFQRSQGQENTGMTLYERLLRVEIPVKSDNETYRIIPLAEQGLMVFYKSLEIADQGKIKWYFSLYDADLRIQWSKGIAINNTLEYFDFSLDSDTLNLLFYNNSKEKTPDQNIQIIRISFQKSIFIGIQGILPENAEPVDFKVCHHKAYIGFNSKNGPARMMIIELFSGKSMTFSFTQQEVSLLAEFLIDTTDGKVISAVRKIFAKNQAGFVLSVFDSSGRSIGETNLNSNAGGNDLKSVSILPDTSGEFIILGTYGTSSGQKSSKNHIPEESTGIYFTSVKDFKQQSISFYNFLEFKNAHLLSGENEMDALKKKAQKKNKNLNEYSLGLTVVLHPPSQDHNQIILLAESFFPQYHTENFTDFDFYGRPFTNTYTIFDGYRFRNAIVAGFDKSGKLLWDNIMEIRNLLSIDLKTKVNVFPSQNNNVLAYLSEGKVASKIIHQGEVIEKIDFSPIESGLPNDKILTETKSRMIPWYKNFFICYGYQEIKNVSLDNNNKRWVFYFNKIRFE